MVVPAETPWTFPALVQLERARLLELLGSLETADWRRPTPCPGWTVLDLATHLLGNDVSFLAWQRDDHHGTTPPGGLDEDGFIAWLDALQREWVHAARRLSPRLVLDLLAWTRGQLVDALDAQDPTARTARVSWASHHPVPVWLDQGRELSEQWLHRQQLLHALGHPSDLRVDLVEPVLDTLRWAYPFRLAATGHPPGTRATIAVTGPPLELRWQLVRDASTWRFDPANDAPADAQLRVTTEQAWRLLSNNLDPTSHGRPATHGDPELTATLLRTRAIIGTPR